MSRRSPRVVVGIPTCNSARFLQHTLDSVTGQTYDNLTIVISDDASTDGTLERCRALAERDRRVRVVSRERRLGWIGNYNALLDYADGDYFCWLPHDDTYAPEYIAAMVALVESDPSAVLAFSGAVLVDEMQGRQHPWTGSGYLDRSGTRLHRALRYLHWSEWEKGWPFHGLMRVTALRKTGGLRALRFAADNVLVFHLSLLGRFAEDSRPLCRKRLYPGSVSTTYGHRLREWTAYLGAHHEVIRAAGVGGREAAILHAAVALRRLRLIASRPFGAARRRLRTVLAR